MTKEDEDLREQEEQEKDADRIQDQESSEEESKEETDSAEGKSEEPSEKDQRIQEIKAKLEKTQSELEEQTEKAEDHLERLMRLQAEFENYRKRVEREKQEYIKYASESIVSELIDVAENLERAVEASGNNGKNGDQDSLVHGVEMTLKQLKDILSKEGLSAIESVGKRFDPNYHEAVGRVDTDEAEKDTVVREIGKGYTLNSKVIRPAKVQVSSGKRKEEEE